MNYYQHGNIIILDNKGDEENIDVDNFINFDISFLNEIKIPDNLIKIQSNWKRWCNPEYGILLFGTNGLKYLVWILLNMCNSKPRFSNWLQIWEKVFS